MRVYSLVHAVGELPAEKVHAWMRLDRLAPRRLIGRLLLMLTAVVGLPWLPILVEPPENQSMKRLPGVTGSPLLRMAIAPNGQILATIDDRGCVALQPIEEGTDPGRRLDVPGFARAIAFSPDGRTLAVGQTNADLLLIGTYPGVPTRTLGLPVQHVTQLAFAPDGRTLAIAASQGREILLWDIEAARPLATLSHEEGVMLPTVLAFAPDGRSLACLGCETRAVLIWDVPSRRLARRLPNNDQIGLAYSPDGRALALVGKGVRIFDPSTGALLQTIAEGLSVHRVAYSPDGLRLATASRDGIARVWDVADGRERMRLDGRTQLLRDLAFSESGRALIAIGTDGDIRRWDFGRTEAP